MAEEKPAYKRVLLKISGEALGGPVRSGTGFPVHGTGMRRGSRCAALGVELGIVVGGGNFWRGVKNGEGHMDRARADYMGMLATVMNSLALQDVLEQQGVRAGVMTAIEIQHIGETFSVDRANAWFREGRVIIFAGGVGSPFFTTDTGTVLRAALVGADIILLAKNVDGVYSADPRQDPSAVRYDCLTYEEVLARHLAVMDSTATCMAMDNHIPVMVFALKDPENILRAVRGETVGTIVR